ncbi:MAG: hypothetical protein IJH12_08945 [Clostridia bacterium]|nr:hypothetical protein [Clostridia bacterium]
MSKKSKKRSEERCKQCMNNKSKKSCKHTKNCDYAKGNKHCVAGKHQDKDYFNPNEHTLDEMASMPTDTVVNMLLNHNDGFFADFAYQYSAVMEVYELIEQYNAVRATCMSNLASNFKAVGIHNDGDYIKLDEQVVKIVLQSTKSSNFKHLQGITKKALPTLKKLNRAIELLLVAFENHSEMDDTQKNFIKGIMLDSKAALLDTFDFIFYPTEEV